jgi:hypothetical protein
MSQKGSSAPNIEKMELKTGRHASEDDFLESTLVKDGLWCVEG